MLTTTITFEDEVLSALESGRVGFKDLLQLKDYIDLDTLTDIFEQYLTNKERS